MWLALVDRLLDLWSPVVLVDEEEVLVWELDHRLGVPDSSPAVAVSATQPAGIDAAVEEREEEEFLLLVRPVDCSLVMGSAAATK